MKVRFTVDAVRHLSSIAAHIRMHHPRAAARVRRRLQTAAERLGDFPWQGRLGAAPGTREWKVPRLPYVIVHEVHGDAGEIVILGVFHAAQMRPGQDAASDYD